MEDTRTSQDGASDVAKSWLEVAANDGTSDVEEHWLEVSAKDGRGVDAIIRAIARKLNTEEASEAPIISNVRHLELLERAKASLGETLKALEEQGQMPEEMLLSDLAQTRAALEELTGRRSTEELLEEIFSKFCIGK